MNTLAGVRIRSLYGRVNLQQCVSLADDIHSLVPVPSHKAICTHEETIYLHCIAAAVIRDIRNKILAYPARSDSEFHVMGTRLKYIDEYAKIVATPLVMRYGIVAPWVPGDVELFTETLIVHALVRYDVITRT